MTDKPASATERTALATGREPLREFIPDVDIYESQTELTAVLDLPGVNEDGLEVAFDDDHLTVRGRAAERSFDEARPVWREHCTGEFRRTFRVREKVDLDAISASFVDGVLTVRLPKAEAKKARAIPISTK